MPSVPTQSMGKGATSAASASTKPPELAEDLDPQLATDEDPQKSGGLRLAGEKLLCCYVLFVSVVFVAVLPFFCDFLEVNAFLKEPRGQLFYVLLCVFLLPFGCKVLGHCVFSLMQY